jgi:hypothetical protein
MADYFTRIISDAGIDVLFPVSAIRNSKTARSTHDTIPVQDLSQAPQSYNENDTVFHNTNCTINKTPGERTNIEETDPSNSSLLPKFNTETKQQHIQNYPYHTSENKAKNNPPPIESNPLPAFMEPNQNHIEDDPVEYTDDKHNDNNRTLTTNKISITKYRDTVSNNLSHTDFGKRIFAPYDKAGNSPINYQSLRKPLDNNIPETESFIPPETFTNIKNEDVSLFDIKDIALTTIKSHESNNHLLANNIIQKNGCEKKDILPIETSDIGHLKNDLPSISSEPDKHLSSHKKSLSNQSSSVINKIDSVNNQVISFKSPDSDSNEVINDINDSDLAVLNKKSNLSEQYRTPPEVSSHFNYSSDVKNETDTDAPFQTSSNQFSPKKSDSDFNDADSQSEDMGSQETNIYIGNIDVIIESPTPEISKTSKSLKSSRTIDISASFMRGL